MCHQVLDFLTATPEDKRVTTFEAQHAFALAG